MTDDLDKYGDHFNEGSFFAKLERYGRKMGASIVYPALLLYKTWVDGDLSVAERAAVVGALGYLVLPFDLIPDFIVPVGYTDDAAMMTMALRIIDAKITPEIQAWARETADEFCGVE
jgi:uncharacterized membrane protein YkvA (DUF1232 family)